MEKILITLNINGDEHQVHTYYTRTLLEVLREDLHINGTKQGCRAGECGACTVLMDDKPVNACMVLAAQAQGNRIVTIEDLAEGDELHPLQKSFVDNGAIQCGYCSPGFIMVGKALLEKTPHPTEDEIKTAVAGNICRCTGYQKIIQAIDKAANGEVVS
ncbi:MAG: carbon-monoxide dehydrogenase small subunit [Desulforhopalus sp.]|jgi:carbon-monoxide dehydrogenase small subunit